jgi:hypothetical protein
VGLVKIEPPPGQARPEPPPRLGKTEPPPGQVKTEPPPGRQVMPEVPHWRSLRRVFHSATAKAQGGRRSPPAETDRRWEPASIRPSTLHRRGPDLIHVKGRCDLPRRYWTLARLAVPVSDLPCCPSRRSPLRRLARQGTRSHIVAPQGWHSATETTPTGRVAELARAMSPRPWSIDPRRRNCPHSVRWPKHPSMPSRLTRCRARRGLGPSRWQRRSAPERSSRRCRPPRHPRRCRPTRDRPWAPSHRHPLLPVRGEACSARSRRGSVFRGRASSPPLAPQTGGARRRWRRRPGTAARAGAAPPAPRLCSGCRAIFMARSNCGWPLPASFRPCPRGSTAAILADAMAAVISLHSASCRCPAVSGASR